MQRKPTKKFWKAYAGLYGEANTAPSQSQLSIALPVVRVSPKCGRDGAVVKSKVLHPTEQDEQFRFVAWLQKRAIPHHHSPNGGFRDAREGAKFKRLGTSAGFPDIFIPRVRKGRYGLYIELKRVSGGKLSPGQLYWRDLLISEGYEWHEAKGADEAIRIVENYLSC